MNKKKQSPLFGVGGVTLLTVLLVLALTMFAVLTLSTAQADMRLSEKNARALKDYYIADSKAVSLQAKAAALWPVGSVKPESTVMLNALTDEYDVGVGDTDQGLIFFCDIPVTDTGQMLQLTLLLFPPDAAERWQVAQWQFVPPPAQMWDEPGLPVSVDGLF